MVLSGEGSDEIFGGYLYFHKAPNKKEFHEETCRKVIKENIFMINLLLPKAAKCILEAFSVVYYCTFSLTT